MNLKNLTHTDGEDNTGGVQRKIYFGRVREIETIPTPTVTSTTADGELADLVTITGNIIMKAYKRFYEIEAVLDENMLESVLQGETNGKSFSQKLSVYISGKKADVLGFGQFVRNGLGLVIFSDNDGQKYLFGSEGYPAKLVDIKFDIPKKAGDRAGVSITWETVQKGPACLFNGKIDLTGSGYDPGEEDFETLFSGT